MSNIQLRSELITLSSKLTISKGMVGTAQREASNAITPNVPAIGLVNLALAVSAQQDALDQILKILEKME